ncbi:Arginine biosynthesis bifunctional protein ArgJ [Legionella massiliensis]|uniref:Arginine biosynthesis bifunctional protein ArgJ n=1 Tax=Legionella massiliensis TaxID=1034943 RepID=A0A078KZD2_9GAMM|nr:bifunctional glutamate N-acetyltransferase/amino-acid acetyltransferase ArgJ [Legionella massiliensis]CDZ78377.1 Arginine biosynthesis bifunctional protein ArgJ [Legionella massiliensis]CEE14115.1 Arginine biosynthesis bifunctional protein ArgJ [Legionella massiliensis]
MMILGCGIFRTKLPIGFTAGGINCGVRQYRPDLGVIISEEPAVATAVFTQNHYKAAPILYCEKILPSEKIKAIITNSGEANAATGAEGVKANLAMASCLAETLGCAPEQILTASTGVIGKPLSIDKIKEAIPQLVAKTTDIAENFATAILTTDLVPKTVYKDVQLSGGQVCITGICKGSGMIHPNMATMLGYLLSDVQLHSDQAQSLLKQACDDSFNMISVDGETSTNDCVFIMANGMSGVSLNNAEDEAIFYEALLEVAIILAKSIARDGEGASKLIEAKVSGAENLTQAKAVAKSIITSPLIKTAIYGESPNWGRIIARIGNENLSLSMLNSCEIVIQGITIFSRGTAVHDLEALNLKEALKKDYILIEILFPQGKHTATAWGCDLTEKYVKINAEYLS